MAEYQTDIPARTEAEAVGKFKARMPKAEITGVKKRVWAGYDQYTISFKSEEHLD